MFPEQKMWVLELEGRSRQVVCWKWGQEVGGAVHGKSPSRREAGVFGDPEEASVAGPEPDQGWSDHQGRLLEGLEISDQET